MSLKTALIIPDCHFPFNDKKKYALMIEAAVDLGDRLKEIVILGDFADFYSVMSHPKDPRVFSMLEDEIVSVLAALSELDHLFPHVQKIFICGNHEHRLERYLCDRAPALFGLTSVEHLFEFNRRPKWRFIPYGPNQSHSVLGSKLIARHEPLGSSAKATAAKALCSLVYGHIHRLEESHIVGLDGTNHVCFSVGWLGDKNQDLIFNYVKSHHQWQAGFGLVHVDSSNGYFYHNKIHILDNNTCVINEKIYKA